MCNLGFTVRPRPAVVRSMAACCARAAPRECPVTARVAFGCVAANPATEDRTFRRKKIKTLRGYKLFGLEQL